MQLLLIFCLKSDDVNFLKFLINTDGANLRFKRPKIESNLDSNGAKSSGFKLFFVQGESEEEECN